MLILFGVMLAGFAIWQLWAIRERVDFMTLQSTNSIRAGGIATELHAIRRGILRYTFDQDSESLADADKRLAHVGTLLETAIRLPAPKSVGPRIKISKRTSAN